MSWNLYFTKDASKDAKKVSSAGLKEKAEYLLGIIRQNPFQNLPPYEKLVGDLTGMYSRRLNIQHRLVYQIIEQEHAIKVLAMWGHYE